MADPKINPDELRNRIKELQTNLSTREETKQNTVDALRKTERAISRISRKLAEIETSKKKIDNTLTRLQAKSARVKNDLKVQQKQLDGLLYIQYTSNQSNHLKALLNQQGPNEFSRNLYYYTQLSHARSEGINRLQNTLTQLKELTHSIRIKRKEAIAIEAEYANQNKILKKEKLEHKATLAKISNEIAHQQNKIDKLIEDEKRITNLVDDINRLLTQNDNNKDFVENRRLPASTSKNVKFPALKGKLNLPVRGKLVGQFGGQRSGRQVTWKGLFIRSPSGSKVKAIAKGKVVFANWLRGFGNLMIIDHAHGYMSLYGHTEALFKQVGDRVQGGDTIATVGTSGGITDAGLYFELRHNGKAFDPLTWIKIE